MFGGGGGEHTLPYKQINDRGDFGGGFRSAVPNHPFIDSHLHSVSFTLHCSPINS